MREYTWKLRKMFDYEKNLFKRYFLLFKLYLLFFICSVKKTNIRSFEDERKFCVVERDNLALGCRNVHKNSTLKHLWLSPSKCLCYRFDNCVQGGDLRGQIEETFSFLSFGPEVVGMPGYVDKMCVYFLFTMEWGKKKGEKNTPRGWKVVLGNLLNDSHDCVTLNYWHCKLLWLFSSRKCVTCLVCPEKNVYG